MRIRESLLLLTMVAYGTCAFAADANAGKNAFRAQCALCHSAEPSDNGGAQGPDLSGVFGRQAASNSAFTYTQALKDSHLTWDAATLDRFLDSPTTVVPGSTMVIPVPKKEDRDNIVAYFAALKDGTFKEVPRPGFGPPPGGPPPAAAAPKGEADWKKDKPGRTHRVKVADLPSPFATESARNFPRVVPRPAGAQPSVPAGFKVDTFAEGLQGPRLMRRAPNGDIFLTETQTGRVKVMRPAADGAKAATTEVFAQGLNQPFGMQFYPAGANPQWLYVAEINRVVRYAYSKGSQKATAIPEVVIPELSPTGGGHFTRDLAFSRDGKRLFVSVGSMTNVGEEIPKKTPAEIKAWEAKHGLGAFWDKEENRAAVLVFDVGATKGKIFATGIRNCVGLTVQPANGEVWCTTNERDGLGDDLVPDYSTRVKEGGYYGWPWYYMGNHEDPRHKGARPDLAGKATVPDVLFTAHSAADNLTFYTATTGASAFPKEYVGDGFAVLHGSWNRAFRTGHKIVRVRMKNDVPTGEYEDFMTGFIVDDGNAWARPVAAEVAADGSLLMSDDGNNVIYRISYSHATAAAPAEIVAPGERLFTESLTSSADGAVIIGSVGGRTIFRAKPGEANAEAWIQPGTEGLAGVFGVLADDKSNTLWACSGTFGGPPQAGAPPPPPSALHAFDLKTGAPKGKWNVPTAGGFCNDIAVGSDGTAYITDTSNMEVASLKPGAKALEVWAGSDGSFGPKGGVLDGIAVVQGKVIVNALRTGKLFSAPIEKDGKAGKVAEVTLDRPLEAPDGQRSWGKDSILVVEGGSGGKLSKVTLSGANLDAGKVTTLKEGFPDGPVAVTVVGETAYVLEGQLGLLRGPPNPDAKPKPFKATAVPVGKP